jgi:catechol 2,3-dioxygenase-like lactoylglutathione lyase family enzyme
MGYSQGVELESSARIGACAGGVAAPVECWIMVEDWQDGRAGGVGRGALHHVELWVPDLERAVESWGWLLTELGYAPFQDWPGGHSRRLGPTYLVLEQSPALSAAEHERTRPGLNHLALHAGDRTALDRLVAESAGYGWALMFGDRHPYAGGKEHYAAYLEDRDGFEIELVAAVPE